MILGKRLECSVKVYAAEARKSVTESEQPRILIGEARLEGANIRREVLIPVKSLSGMKALYLEFRSDTAGDVCELNKLRFVTEARS